MNNFRRAASCWCGNDRLNLFNSDYSLCAICATLVSVNCLAIEPAKVNDDDVDFYGKQYWLNHQSSDLGLPDIFQRARNDLSERNLHWLKTLLKYRLPPAKILELGCAHGSFVALLRQAGYDAHGVEMSPWVVEFGQKTFDALIFVGPVETLDIELNSLDAIVLMDVLEHLSDPVATMAHCARLLKPDGILLIQTPQFKKEMDYNGLVETKAAFLELLKPDEHLYLFSEQAITNLFNLLGISHIQFETAIFSHYDMFFVASRAPFQNNTQGHSDSVLLAKPQGRFVLALLDLHTREQDLIQKLMVSESDRTARGEQIQTLTALLKELEPDRTARGEQIVTLTAMLKESEADRTLRGEQIATLTAMLKESDSILMEVRAFFARPVFNWLLRFSKWLKIRQLVEWIGRNKEKKFQ